VVHAFVLGEALGCHRALTSLRDFARPDHPFCLARASNLLTGGWTVGAWRHGMTVEALRRGEPEVLAELLEQHGTEIQGVA
jgi:hypothetical protein